MELGMFEILGITVVLFFLIRYYLSRTSSFWKTQGVKGPDPVPFFGTIKEVMLLKSSIGQYMKKMYLEYPTEPLVGLYTKNMPLLLIRDLDLIKDVLIKDFSTFSSRGLKVNMKAEPLAEHLVTMEPEKWRPLRAKMTPLFSSGKLKEMFFILIECGEGLTKFMENIAAKGEPVEIRELTAKYTTDVIGSAAFGLQMNALSESESQFRKMGRKVFERSWWRIAKIRVRNSFPALFNIIWPIFYEKELTDFFVNSIKQTIEYREKNNIKRNDFVDLLKDFKDHPDSIKDIEITDTMLAAQAFMFFTAGFETSSTTMSYALYELAQHTDIQEKLRKEIKDELNKNDGVLQYESIKNMKYMHQVFQETLRKHPPATILMRKSCDAYTFKGTSVTIPKDQAIFISPYGIHYDPTIYPNPEIFDPERFEEEAVKARHPMSFLGFGDGPRNCIGLRFADHQTKVGLAYILRDYKVSVCDKTEIPYVVDPTGFLLTPRNGIYLQISKITE